MTTSYPSNKQTIPNYSGTAAMSDIDHAGWHGLTNDTVMAIEDVLGTTAGTSVLKNFNAGDFCAKSSDIPPGLAKATSDEIDIGTDDSKFITPNGIYNAKLFPKNIHGIYCIGDSITHAGTYESQLETLLGSDYWKVYNRGVNAEYSELILNRIGTDVLSNQDAEYVVVMAGVNDMQFGLSAATVEANLQAMYTACHNAGLKVISVNITPFKGVATWDITKQGVLDTINYWIAHTATNIDYYVDAWTLLVDPDVAYTLLPAYDDGSHIHPTTAGYQQIANAIYNNTTWVKGDLGKIDPSYTEPQYPRPNILINENMNIWQNGTTFTNPGVGAITSDHWMTTFQTDSGTPPTNIIHSKVALSPNNVFKSLNCYQIDVDGAGSGYGVNSYYGISQKIENGVRNYCGAGRNVTISFYGRSTISNKKVAMNFFKIYGTGGSPTSAEQILFGKVVTLDSLWKKYTVTLELDSIANKTFGTNNDDQLWFILSTQWGSTRGTDWFSGADAEGWGGSGVIQLTQFKIEEGETATDFVNKDKNTELLECFRFHEEGYINGCYKQNSTSERYGISASYKATKRITPTTVIYQSSATLSTPNKMDVAGSEVTGTVLASGDKQFYAYTTNDVGGTGAWYTLSGYYVSDCEFA